MFPATVRLFSHVARTPWRSAIKIDGESKKLTAGPLPRTIAIVRPLPRVAIGEWGLQTLVGDCVEEAPVNARTVAWALAGSCVSEDAVQSLR